MSPLISLSLEMHFAFCFDPNIRHLKSSYNITASPFQCTIANYVKQKLHSHGTTHPELSSKVGEADVGNLQTSLEPTAALLALTQDTSSTLPITFGPRCGQQDNSVGYMPIHARD